MQVSQIYSYIAYSSSATSSIVKLRRSKLSTSAVPACKPFWPSKTSWKRPSSADLPAPHRSPLTFR
ncbi:MAG: hypothetical protein ACTS6P_01340, partial [Candidatus Hodgkinia cicadicola]